MSKVITKPKFKLFLILLAVIAAVSLIAGLAVNMVFGKPEEPKQLNSFMPSELNLGTDFTLDDIIESMEYRPLWLRSNAIDVKLYSKKSIDGEESFEEGLDIFSYSPETRTFTICGVGSGEIRIYSTVDSAVSMILPFDTGFATARTEAIIRENAASFYDDGVISASEIASVGEIRLSSAGDTDVTDLAHFPSLRRIVFTAETGVAKVGGLSSVGEGVHFLVHADSYDAYISTNGWSEYYERIFPIVDLNENKNSVVFEFNGGDMVKAEKGDTNYFTSIDSGKVIPVSDYKITKTGHTFLGWYISPDKGATLTEKVDGKVINGNTKVYAKWSENRYTVTYNDRFIKDLPADHVVRYSETFTVSNTTLTYPGYTFLGWASIDNAPEVEYESGVTLSKLTAEDNKVVNLYGVWAANNYTVKYNANGGEGAPLIVHNATYGVPFSLSEEIPTRRGYRFVGWAVTKNAKPEECYAPGASVQNLASDLECLATLYAIWDANVYRIVYDANGGINPPTEQSGLLYDIEYNLSKQVPTKPGSIFLGWTRSDGGVGEPEFEEGNLVKNLTDEHNRTVKLFAVWHVPGPFELNFNDNGGWSGPGYLTLIYGTRATVPNAAPVRAGHTFAGWILGGDTSKTYWPGDTLDENTVNSIYLEAHSMVAKWSVNYYTITITESGEKGGSISGIVNGGSYAYGTVLTAKPSYDGNKDEYISYNGVNVGKDAYTFTVTENATIDVHSNQECLATGSMITLADGTAKPVEELDESDMLLVFDHETGRYISAPILFIERDGWKEYRVINLVFSNGNTTRIIGEHAFFDLTLNKYVYIDAENCLDFVGHSFALTERSNDPTACTTLSDAFVTVEETGCYSLVTEYHMNYFVDGLYSMPGGIKGLFNMFEYADDLTYDRDLMAADIERYGVYTYEDFKDYIPYEIFEYMFPTKYFKVSVEKGLITYDEILALIEKYLVGHGII